MDSQPRYDPEKGIYRDCRWCQGRGCVHCPAEAEKEYKRQFPDGPKPIATFKLSDAGDMKSLRSVLGPEAIMAAKAEGNRRAADILKEYPVVALTGLTPERAKQALGTSVAAEIIQENLVKMQKRRKPKEKPSAQKKSKR